MSDNKFTETPESNALVNQVVLAIPPFQDLDVNLWFMRLEAEFDLNRIVNDRLKFNHLFVRLPHEVTTRLRDALLQLPPDNRYEHIKKLVIQQVAPSDRARIQHLLHGLNLGDMTPSALLARMHQILGSSIDETLLRELWLDKLPREIQFSISAYPSQPITQTAESADRLMEYIHPRYALPTYTSPLSPSPTYNQPSSTVSQAEFVSAVATMQRMFNQMSFNSRRPRSCSKKRRSYSRSPSKSARKTTGFCWYHERFGPNAQKCTKPCSFQSNQGN